MVSFLPALEDLFWRCKTNPSDIQDRHALPVGQARELTADPLVEIGAHGITQ
jgi:hypothetical protein